MLEDPPVDTRQIMQPETYLLHQVVPQLKIPDFDKMVAPDYERFDFGGMGEFDMYLLAKQYGAKDPPNYYRHWRGGYYFAAPSKTAPKDQIAMLYFSRGIRPKRRATSSSSTLDYLPKRYQRKVNWTSNCSETRREWGRQDVILIVGTDEGRRSWIEQHDNDVLIMEGYR